MAGLDTSSMADRASLMHPLLADYLKTTICWYTLVVERRAGLRHQYPISLAKLTRVFLIAFESLGWSKWTRTLSPKIFLALG